MVKELLNNWLEQRRKSSFPPLEAHEADKLLAFASWADSEAAQHRVQADKCFVCGTTENINHVVVCDDHDPFS